MIKIDVTDVGQSHYSYDNIISMRITKSYYVPADQLTISFLCDRCTSRFNEISVRRENTLLFSGNVDSQEFMIDKNGTVVTITARSAGAKLIDNQAKPTVYSYPTLAQILADHVTPYGISCQYAEPENAMTALTVTPRTSEWQVVSAFFSECFGAVAAVNENSQLICRYLSTQPSDNISNSVNSFFHYYSVRKRYKSSHLTSHMYILNNQTGVYSNTVFDSPSESYGVYRKEYSQYDPDEIYAKEKSTLTRFKQQHLDDCVYSFCTDYNPKIKLNLCFKYSERQIGEYIALTVTELRHIIDNRGERLEFSAIPPENGY